MGQLFSKNEAESIVGCHEAVVQVVGSGDIRRLKSALRDGLDVNCLIKKTSLLHVAVKYRQTECIKLLLENKADPNLNNSLGLPPIFEIFYRETRKKSNETQDIHILESLLKAKADINVRNNAQRTPLFKSIVEREKHITDYLLSENADVNTGDIDGLLPIHVCATLNSVPLLRKLVQHGAYIDGQDIKGRTALYYSVLSGHNDVFKELIANQCDVNIFSTLGCPLQVGVVCCREEMVRILLENGASVACAINENRFNLRKSSDILNLALTILQIKLTKLISGSLGPGATDKVQSAIAVLQLILQAQGSNGAITYNPFFKHSFQNNFLQHIESFDAKLIFMLQNVYQKLGFLISASKQGFPHSLQTGVFKVDECYQGRSLTLQNLCRMRVRGLLMRGGANVISVVKDLDCSIVIKDILLLRDIFKLQ